MTRVTEERTITFLICAAMAADYITFALAVPSVGIEAEMNPIMNAGYAGFGILPVLALKLLCTVLICALVLRIHRVRLRRLAASLAIVIALVGVFGNVGSWWIA
jgi:hypothetical protein